MTKKYLICGATGFIGRNLVNYFASDRDNQITAICYTRPPFDTPDNVTWVQGNLLDAKFVDSVMADVDIVIQAAATTSGAGDIVNTPYIHVTDNALMNSLLLRAAFEAKIQHFIFFSCTVMYPSSTSPVKESDFSGVITDKYFGVGWTKVYVEKMCEFFAGLGNTKYTVIRHSNIYGPWDKFDFKRSHVFGATMSKVLSANDEIEVWGSGEELRDLLHVDDLMEFVNLSLLKQSSSFELLNCGYGKAITINELVSLMLTASGKRLKIKHNSSKPTIPFNLCLNCEQAKKKLNWQPQIELTVGIERTIQWWRSNIDPVTLAPREMKGNK